MQKKVVFTVPTWLHRAGDRVGGAVRFTLKELKEGGTMIDKRTNGDLTLFSKVFMGVGAFTGTYVSVSTTAAYLNNHHRSYDTPQADMLFAGAMGGLTGAAIGLMWPVGIPALAADTMAKRKYNNKT